MKRVRPNGAAGLPGSDVLRGRSSKLSELQDASLDALSALHELQVHQIELEAQNAELARLKRELEWTLENYSVLYQNAPVACLYLDFAGTIMQANRSGGDMLGAKPARLIGQSLTAFFRIADRDRIAALLNTSVPAIADRALEIELQPLDRCDPVLVSLQVASDQRAGMSLVTLTDVTELRQLEQALLDSSHREQMRLAADLHDGLGQELAGLCMRVTAMAHDAERGVALQPRELRECVSDLNHALEECRALARGVSPLALYQGGLVEALRQEAVRCEALGGPQVAFRLDEGARIHLAQGHLDHLYRIAQEALSNARRHGAASHIETRLTIRPDAITLSIIDDGDGFDTAAATAGLGLRLMQHRAALMRARLSVMSTPGTGTEIVCTMVQEQGAPAHRRGNA